MPRTVGLDFYSGWPLLVCAAVLLAVAATPLFRAADTPPSPQPKRIATLDGVRGFLALAVVFHHAAVYHAYLLTGDWVAPPAKLLRQLGPCGVAFFFMITGFLFWSRLIRTHGRPGWISLYVGRVFRIGPLYLAALAVVLAVVAWRTGPALHEPAGELAGRLLAWLSLGLLPLPDLNGYRQTDLLLAEVTWTLRWEWLFYLSLPLLAIFARTRKSHMIFVISAILAVQGYLHLWRGAPYKPVLGPLMVFLLGMLSASLAAWNRLARLPDALGSTLCIVLLVAAFHFDRPDYNTVPQIMLGAVFYLIVSGSSRLFGLLTLRPALRLGDISYGIYLLQGLALAIVFRHAWARGYDAASPGLHWLLSLAAALILIALATATHVWIERPGIRAGKKIAGKLASRFGVSLAPPRSASAD